MKLLYCRACGDIFNLRVVREKSCSCGKTRGRYEDDGLHAWFEGDEALPLGFQNSSFRRARDHQPEIPPGLRFEAFVIEKNCATFVKKEVKS